MRIASNMLPQRAAYFSDAPTRQGDRILIPCIDVDWQLESDLITGPLVVDRYSILLLLLEN
jgi:hypothetical protein